MTDIAARLFTNSKKLGIVLCMASLLALASSKLLGESIGFILGGTFLTALYITYLMRIISKLAGSMLLPAVFIWWSSFLFLSSINFYPNNETSIYGSLSFLIGSLLFGMFRIVNSHI